jgi:hypothetical protein
MIKDLRMHPIPLLVELGETGPRNGEVDGQFLTIQHAGVVHIGKKREVQQGLKPKGTVFSNPIPRTHIGLPTA